MPLAIPESVSPRSTTCVPPPAAAAGAALVEAGLGAGGGASEGAVSAGAGQLRRARRGGGGCGRFAAASDLARARTGTGTGRGDRGARCRRLTRRVQRRIEQHRVFAHQLAVRPDDLDQQRNEGLGYRIGRGELHDLAAVRRAHGLDLNAGQIGRIVEALGGERVTRGERHLQGVYLVGGNVGDLDLRVKRGVERRKEMNVPEADGKGR